MAMLNKEDVEMRATGEIYDNPKVLAHGKPLYEIINLKTGERVYPANDFEKGWAFEFHCKEWVRENTRWPGDKEFKKTLLEKLIESSEEEESGKKELGDIRVAENKLTYQGNIHAEFILIFEQNGEYYKLPWYDYYGSTCLGKWSISTEDVCHLDDNTYLCRRVYPKEETIKVTRYKREKD